MKIYFFLLVILLGFLFSCTLRFKEPKTENPKIKICEILRKKYGFEKIIFVVSENWTTNQALLSCWEQQNDNWIPALENEKAVIGIHGMAWGLGLHSCPKNAYLKKEGDLKTPAGIFSFGAVFSDSAYVSFLKTKKNLIVNEKSLCIDDAASAYYNQIIDKNTGKDWKRWENMYRQDGQYKFGVEVLHNPERIPEKGSCIFFHIEPNEPTGTAGCTAVKEELLLLLLSKKIDDKTVLVQAPQSELENFGSGWGLLNE